LLLAGCGAGSTAGGPPTSAAANQGSGAVTTTGGPASPPPATGDPSCGVRSVVVTAREQPAPLCVHAGASLRITTEPSPHQPWSMPASSDATVLRCIGSRVLADGAVEAVC